MEGVEIATAYIRFLEETLRANARTDRENYNQCHERNHFLFGFIKEDFMGTESVRLDLAQDSASAKSGFDSRTLESGKAISDRTHHNRAKGCSDNG